MAVNPIHWFELKAAEAQRLADTFTNPATKRNMLALAASYLQMAARARMKAKAKLRSARAIPAEKLRTKKNGRGRAI